MAVTLFCLYLALHCIISILSIDILNRMLPHDADSEYLIRPIKSSS